MPTLAVAALLVREDDGRVLLAEHASGPLRGRWALPSRAIGADEVAEQALAHLLHDHLYLQPGSADFADTLTVGPPDAPVVLNVFLVLGWRGRPRFAPQDFRDLVWVDAAAPAEEVDLLPEVATWLGAAADSVASGRPLRLEPADVGADLAAARDALLEAYDAFDALPAEVRLAWPLDGEWAAVDVIAHAASVEAYYRAEAARLLAVPGHTWRPFNEDQAEAERRTRPRPDEHAERARLEAVRAETLAWLETLSAEDLAAYGNHATRGAVRVGERVQKIARHDEEHARQLRAMRDAAERRALASIER